MKRLPDENPTIVRDTSLETYRKIDENGLLSKERMRVYKLLFAHGPCTSHELYAKTAKTPISKRHSFSARLCELVDAGVVKECYRRKDEVSGNQATVFDVTPLLPRPPNRGARLRRKILNTKEQERKIAREYMANRTPNLESSYYTAVSTTDQAIQEYDVFVWRLPVAIRDPDEHP